MTLALLLNDVLPPHFVLVMAMTAVLCLNLVPTELALAGFSNEGVLTIAVLFVVAKVCRALGGGTIHSDALLMIARQNTRAAFAQRQAMEINGVLQVVTKYILRQPKKLWDAQLRLILPVAVRRWPPPLGSMCGAARR